MQSYQIAPKWKVLSAFVVGSLFIGLIFALAVSRPTLQYSWFHYREYWVLPTRKMSLLASSLFCLNLAGACLIARARNWLSFFSTYRLIVGLVITATLPLLGSLIEPLPLLIQFISFRSILVVLLTLTLRVVTREWYWGIAGLMLAASLATPLLGSLPYAVIQSLSPEWFEISQFFVGSLLLSALFGYWFIKADAPEKGSATANPRRVQQEMRRPAETERGQHQ
jgi:hypothetical protein